MRPRPPAGSEVCRLGGSWGRGPEREARRRHVAFMSMPENELDPGASTQMFQAFVDSPEPEASGSRWMWVVLGAAVVAGLLLALAWLVLGA